MVHESCRVLPDSLPRAGEGVATSGRSPGAGSPATIEAHATTPLDRSPIVLKWTLRAVAVLAIAAAIAAPVAVPASEPALTAPAVAVAAAAGEGVGFAHLMG